MSDDPAAERRLKQWAATILQDFAAAPHRPAVDALASRFGEKRKWLAKHRPLTAEMIIKAMDAAYERVRNVPIPPLNKEAA